MIPGLALNSAAIRSGRRRGRGQRSWSCAATMGPWGRSRWIMPPAISRPRRDRITRRSPARWSSRRTKRSRASRFRSFGTPSLKAAKTFRVTLSNPTGGATLGTRDDHRDDSGQLLHADASGRFQAGDPAGRGRQHPHLDRRRTTAKGGPSDGALADARGRPESVHRPVSGSGDLLPGQTPQAGEPLRPFKLRRPNAHAPRDPAARVRLEAGSR